MRKKVLLNQGMTFVEVLVAIVFLGIALLSIALCFIRGSAAIGEIRQRIIATQAAKEKIESIRDMAYADILTMSSGFTGTGFDNLRNPVGTVTVDSPFGEANIRRVTVTLTWDSPKGRSLSTSLATLVTNEGINKQ